MEKLVKTCEYLDGNISGHIDVDIAGCRISPCCNTSVPALMENIDWSNWDESCTVQLLEKRKELSRLLNEGKSCHGCANIIKKAENEIDLNKIRVLAVAPFTTCNFRCTYCLLDEALTTKKLPDEQTYLKPILDKMYESGLAKNVVNISIAGGEPLLINDMNEVIDFLDKKDNIEISFISNSSIKNKAEKLADDFANASSNIKKILYTSIDCGTPETFKKTRNTDLFNTVCENILNYIKKESFDEYLLKYIFLFDQSNASDKDIFGFASFAQRAQNVLIGEDLKGKLSIVISVDFLAQDAMTDKMINAASKLYYIINNILNINVLFIGGTVSENTTVGKKTIEAIKAQAECWAKEQKTSEEEGFLCELKSNIIKRPSQSSLRSENKIFSIGRRQTSIIVRFLGIKITFKNKIIGNLLKRKFGI